MITQIENGNEKATPRTRAKQIIYMSLIDARDRLSGDVNLTNVERKKISEQIDKLLASISKKVLTNCNYSF